MKKIVRNRQGYNLLVHIEGKKFAPILMFSNSLGTDHKIWEQQVTYLKNYYQIIRYDTRGHGKSDVTDEPTIKNLSEDVIDILDNLKIDKVHFCGISMGGITGLYLGANYSERFSSIIIANSAAKIWTTEGWLKRVQDVVENGLTNITKDTHKRWFKESFNYKDNSLAQKTIMDLSHMPAQGYINACKALAIADLRETIEKIKIPTLVIAGKYDSVTTIADSLFVKEKVKESKLEIIDASHLSCIEASESFNKIILNYIK